MSLRKCDDVDKIELFFGRKDLTLNYYHLAIV